MIFRIDKRKEFFTITVASLIFLVVFSLLAFIGLNLLKLVGGEHGLSPQVFILICMALFLVVIFILVKNSIRDIRNWSFEIVDDDTFILKTGKGSATYTLTQIRGIDMRDPSSLFVVLHAKKRLYINSNLERYPTISAYFLAMKNRLRQQV